MAKNHWASFWEKGAAVDFSHCTEDVYKRQDLNILWSIHNDNRAAITTPLDRFVEDGSYLRISTITLSYTFPKKWLSKASVSYTHLDVYKRQAYIPGRNTSYHHISYEVIGYKDIIGCTGSYLGAKKNRSKGK